MTELAFSADTDTGLPPLLLVHGMLVSRRTWDLNMPLRQQFRLICVDLPGHGASPALADAGEAHPDALVRALDRVREKLGIDRWHLCGQSFGAALVLRYALDLPDKSGAVVFTNGNAALRQNWSDEAATATAGLVAQIRDEGHAAIRRMPYHPARARHFPPEIHGLLCAEADATDPGSIALLQQEAIPYLSVRDRIKALARPAMLVNGLRERRFQSARDWLAQVHPDVRIVDLEGGHSINVECAEGFNAAVRSFLETVPL